MHFPAISLFSLFRARLIYTQPSVLFSFFFVQASVFRSCICQSSISFLTYTFFSPELYVRYFFFSFAPFLRAFSFHMSPSLCWCLSACLLVSCQSVTFSFSTCISLRYFIHLSPTASWSFHLFPFVSGAISVSFFPLVLYVFHFFISLSCLPLPVYFSRLSSLPGVVWFLFIYFVPLIFNVCSFSLPLLLPPCSLF